MQINIAAVGSKELTRELQRVPSWLVKKNKLYAVLSNAQSREFVDALIRLFVICSIIAGVLCSMGIYSTDLPLTQRMYCWIAIFVTSLVMPVCLYKLSQFSRVVHLTESKDKLAESEVRSFKLIRNYLNLGLGVLDQQHQESYAQEQHLAYLIGLARKVKKCELAFDRATQAHDKSCLESRDDVASLVTETDAVKAKKSLDTAREILNERFGLLWLLGLITQDKGKIFGKA